MSARSHRAACPRAGRAGHTNTRASRARAQLGGDHHGAARFRHVANIHREVGLPTATDMLV